MPSLPPTELAREAAERHLARVEQVVEVAVRFIVIREVLSQAGLVASGYATSADDAVDAATAAYNEWQRGLDNNVLPAVSIGFGEGFQQLRLQDRSTGTFTPQMEYMQNVSDRLRIWPEGAFEELRPELVEALAEAESIEQIKDRVGRVLQIDVHSREVKARINEVEAELADPSVTGPHRAQLRALRRELWAEHDAELSKWEWKARRIARTETHGAVQAGQLAAARQIETETGETYHKRWLSTEDVRTRVTHRVADGQTVPLTGKFRVGGFLLDFPGDPIVVAPHETINCRCTLLILDPDALQDSLQGPDSSNGTVEPGGVRYGTDDPDDAVEAIRDTAEAEHRALPDDVDARGEDHGQDAPPVVPDIELTDDREAPIFTEPAPAVMDLSGYDDEGLLQLMVDSADDMDGVYEAARDEYDRRTLYSDGHADDVLDDLIDDATDEDPDTEPEQLDLLDDGQDAEPEVDGPLTVDTITDYSDEAVDAIAWWITELDAQDTPRPRFTTRLQDQAVELLADPDADRGKFLQDLRDFPDAVPGLSDVLARVDAIVNADSDAATRAWLDAEAAWFKDLDVDLDLPERDPDKKLVPYTYRQFLPDEAIQRRWERSHYVQVSNPSFRDGDIANTINCQRAVQALELNYRGYQVQARPNTMIDKDTDPSTWSSLVTQFDPSDERGRDEYARQFGVDKADITFEYLSDLWREQDGGIRRFSQAYDRSQVESEILAAYPDGARGWVAGTWKAEDAAHIFSWEVQADADGVLHVEWMDGQTGALDNGKRVDDLRPGSIMYMRVDDLVPTKRVESMVQAGEDRNRMLDTPPRPVDLTDEDLDAEYQAAVTAKDTARASELGEEKQSRLVQATNAWLAAEREWTAQQMRAFDQFDRLPQLAPDLDTVAGRRAAAARVLQNVGATNPQGPEGGRFRINCQRVVQAFELRDRGYDVIADHNVDPSPGVTPESWSVQVLDSPPFKYPLSISERQALVKRMYPDSEGFTDELRAQIKLVHMQDLWKERDGQVRKFTQVRNKTALMRDLKDMPVGARGAVGIRWSKKAGSGAHVFNWRVDRNWKTGKPEVRFLDAQTFEADVSHYLSPAMLAKNTPMPLSYMRFDDLIPDEQVADMVLRSGTVK